LASCLPHSSGENREAVPTGQPKVALSSPIPCYRSRCTMDALVLEAPQDIQASSPLCAVLIPQQTANLSTDDQEPPKHSGKQGHFQSVCTVLCDIFQLLLQSQPHLGPELPRPAATAHANKTSQPRASKPLGSSAQPTEHPFPSSGPGLGSQADHHRDMPQQNPTSCSVSSLCCSSWLPR